MKPVMIGRVVLKERGINDFLVHVSELRWSFFPYSVRQPVSDDKESHPTALNTSVCGEKKVKSSYKN